jgi:hypothetical protein
MPGRGGHVQLKTLKQCFYKIVALWFVVGVGIRLEVVPDYRQEQRITNCRRRIEYKTRRETTTILQQAQWRLQ